MNAPLAEILVRFWRPGRGAVWSATVMFPSWQMGTISRSSSHIDQVHMALHRNEGAYPWLAAANRYFWNFQAYMAIASR